MNARLIHDEMCNVLRMAGAFSTLVPSWWDFNSVFVATG